MTATLTLRSAAGRLAVGSLLVLLAAGGLLWGVTHVAQRPWRAPPAVPVTLEGQHYRVPPGELSWLEGFSAQHFAEGEEKSREVVEKEIDARLDGMFAEARDRVPAFADWYYSLRGEYARVGMRALSAVGLAAPEYVAREAAQTLFPKEVWTADLEALQQQTEARLRAHEAAVRESWLAEVNRHLGPHRVPAPLPGDTQVADRDVDLDGLVQNLVSREHAALTTRLSLSTVAGGGAALAPALWRAAGRGAEEAGARAAGERLAAGGAARIGESALGGGAVCAPGGPLALGCALVAGTAAWVGTDWALLRLDEHLHRQQFVGEVDASLGALQVRMREALLDAYDRIIAGHYDAVQDDIRHSFVPARAGVGEAGSAAGSRAAASGAADAASSGSSHGAPGAPAAAPASAE